MNFSEFIQKPTNATLKEGKHLLTLISYEPIEKDEKKPYLKAIFRTSASCQTVHNLFERDLIFLAKNGKEFYNMEETNASIAEILEKMKSTQVPVYIQKKQIISLTGEEKTFINWNFFKQATEEKKEDFSNEK